MKPSGIVSFYNVPDDAGDPDVKVYVNNELVESGGGSGDLTTATITLAYPDGSSYMDGQFPIIDNDKGVIVSLINIGGDDNACLANNTSYQVPLYKGKYTGIGFAIAQMDIDGDGEYDGYYLTVTGDCTITYWGAPK